MIIPFSNEAPKWRTVSAGLCLEFHCPWTDCQAHQKSSAVIIRMGINESAPFDLFMDHTVTCPSCKREHILNGQNGKLDLTAGFCHCQWRMDGIMIGERDEPIIRSTQWQCVDMEYHRFDGKHETSSQARWLRLRIYTRELQPGCDYESAEKVKMMEPMCNPVVFFIEPP